MSGQIEEGDKVSWKWGSGNPSGTAAEVKPDDVTIVSHRGNEITKHGKEDNPAVHVERSGNDVVKLASELTVVEKGESARGNGETNGSVDDGEGKPIEKVHGKKDDGEHQDHSQHDSKTKDEKSVPETGDKRKSDKKASDDDVEVTENEDAPKKQKTKNGAVAKSSTPAAESKESATSTKRKPGRPKGSGTTANGERKPAAEKKEKEKKEKKAPALGRAERKTRSQGNVE